jgi:hypothetical protein
LSLSLSPVRWAALAQCGDKLREVSHVLRAKPAQLAALLWLSLLVAAAGVAAAEPGRRRRRRGRLTRYRALAA